MNKIELVKKYRERVKASLRPLIFEYKQTPIEDNKSDLRALILGLQEQLQPIIDNTQFIKNIYSKPKKIGTIPKKKDTMENKMKLRNSILSRGKKGV